MTKNQNSSFKAVIIGGSVAGLTLAHCFEKAKIDYVLVEARNTISPELGASIVLQPNGSRIFDQLGLYDTMCRDFMGLLKTFNTWRSDGRSVSTSEVPKILGERLGYTPGICDRRLFLRSLYDQLEDNTKIFVGKKVKSIRHDEHSASVLCADGSEFVGDIVIGADGIHSITRREMQRYARETGPPGLMDADENAITAEYSCIFGISKNVPSLERGHNHVTREVDHSSLTFVDTEGQPQWLFFSKLDRLYRSDIPRFTQANMDAVIEEFADFHVTDKLRLKDLANTSTTTSYLSLEEGNHEHWTYGRIVCLGDAVHKMTPNFGQGGNQAIESAAVLTNCLYEILSQNHGAHPSIEDIKTTLTHYQNLRKHRAEKHIRLSGLMTRYEALANLEYTLRLLYSPPPSDEQMLKQQIELYQTAPWLKFLPLPPGVVRNEFWIAGSKKTDQTMALRARM